MVQQQKRGLIRAKQPLGHVLKHDMPGNFGRTARATDIRYKDSGEKIQYG